MYLFDASSFIYAWDNYPPAQFPSLWDWMGDEFEAGEYQIPQVAYEEVMHKYPEAGAWLKKNSAQRIALSNVMLQTALSIKNTLGIVNDGYKGVGENDLFIISTAKVLGVPLVSNEGIQTKLPEIMARYKIPAVCALSGVQVKCLNFLELIRLSGRVFG